MKGEGGESKGHAKLINEESTFINLDKTEINIEENKEKVNVEENSKIEKEYILSFLNKTVFLNLLLIGITLGIDIILVTFPEETLSKSFSKTWWGLIPSGALFLFSVIFSYYNKKRILSPQSNWFIYLISLYVFSYLFFITIISFKFTKVFLSFFILISVGLSLILFFNMITLCYENDLLKLILIYSYSFVHFIVYIILAKKYYVEFFILMVVSFLYFAYVNKEMKKLLIEFVKEEGVVIKEEGVGFRTVVTGILVMPLDVILATFK